MNIGKTSIQYRAVKVFPCNKISPSLFWTNLIIHIEGTLVYGCFLTTYLTTYISGDIVIKLIQDEVIQTQNRYAILILY